MHPNYLVEKLKQLEAAVTYRHPPPDGGQPFSYAPGRVPILISAPHGAAHWRKGKLKPEDEFTTGYARLLAEETGAHVLFATHRMSGDPNWDRHSPYKRCIAEIVQRDHIRFVLDIHGMSNRYKIGLAVGTMNGRSCPDHEPLIIETLKAHGFRSIPQAAVAKFPRLQWDHFVLNHSKFTGGVTSHTVTRYASQKLGVPAVQIEICSSLRIVERPAHDGWQRPFRGDAHGIERAIKSLAAVVRYVVSNT